MMRDDACDLELLRSKVQSLTVQRAKEFTLTSGKKSSLYFDMKATTMDPVGGHLAAQALINRVGDLKFDYVAGIAMGAVPLVARMIEILRLERPVTGLIARNEAKAHGMGRQIEGVRDANLLRRKRVLIVEDVTTTGGSMSTAVTALRLLGAVVSDAVCIVMRSPAASDRLFAEDVRLRHLFTEEDFH